jgi:hypothetical protein
MKPGRSGSVVESFMDRASSLIYPGSKTVAGWWRQLAPRHPTTLAIGYGFLHRVDAPVHVLEEKSIDSLSHLVLQALALEGAKTVGVADMQERLHLPVAMVRRMLAVMRDDGLLAGADTEGWQPTERGRAALERRSFPVHVLKRRSFPFLECLDAAGNRLAAPQFVPIGECASAAWSVDDGHRFDVNVFQRCLEQASPWKHAHRFPQDVEPLPADGTLEAWQRVVVDRPERIMLALVVVGGESGKEVHGFAVKVDGWTLFDGAPVLRMPALTEPDALWPELLQPPPMPVLQDAWRSWCKQRQMPGNEVEMCTLTYQPPRLAVHAPPRLVQRLQAAKSDLFKGDAWILVGDGYLRSATQLAIATSRDR